MQFMHSNLLLKASLCGLLALVFVAQASAQDKKADAAGTWTWTVPGRNGGPDRKMTLHLKVEGDKLSGKLTSPGRQGTPTETEIQDGKLKGDEVSFAVVREFNGNKITSKYNGKVTADAIKGKVEIDRGSGDPMSRDWEAKREAEKK